MKKTIIVSLTAAVAFAAEGYHVLGKIQIGGEGGWDYLLADGANHRLYATHGTSVVVVDTRENKVLGAVSGLQGVHGVAVVPKLNKGFISDGRANQAVVFDLKTLAKTGEVATGANPDSICYEPRTNRILTFNGRSNDSTVIDAATNAVVATIPVGPKPEFCAADGAGKVYVNIETSGEIVEIDAAKPAVLRRAPLAPCEEPSGLAIDPKGRKLFSVCGNKIMAITDIPTLKVIATPAIGQGPDAAGYDSGLAFSSNGEGTLTVVRNVNGKWEPAETVRTERGARTMAVDPETHKLYLLAADFEPAPEAKEGQKGGRRPAIIPGSFHVLIVGK